MIAARQSPTAPFAMSPEAASMRRSWRGYDGPASGQTSLSDHRQKRAAFGHQFDANGRLKNVSARSESHPALRHLRYRQGQTFGIELELTREDYPEPASDEWSSTAHALLDLLSNKLGSHRVAAEPYTAYHDSRLEFDVWNVEFDSTCGWAEPSPHITPKISRHTACSRTMRPNASISGRSHSSRMVGIA
jgi:hypothetical protein